MSRLWKNQAMLAKLPKSGQRCQASRRSNCHTWVKGRPVAALCIPRLQTFSQSADARCTIGSSRHKGRNTARWNEEHHCRCRGSVITIICDASVYRFWKFCFSMQANVSVAVSFRLLQPIPQGRRLLLRCRWPASASLILSCIVYLIPTSFSFIGHSRPLKKTSIHFANF